MNADVLHALLRDPDEVARRAATRDGLRELASVALGALVLGAAAFGGVIGSFRGGTQIVFSAVKLPLALLATLVVTVPAFYALATALGAKSRFETISVLTLSAAARAALVLLGAAPVLWLVVDHGIDYHRAVLLAVGIYALSGLSALGIVLKGLGGGMRALITATLCGAVFFGVLGQTAWMLRPFFGRPSQEVVPFVRQREGTFADSVAKSRRSAVGVYDEVRNPRYGSEEHEE